MNFKTQYRSLSALLALAFGSLVVSCDRSGDLTENAAAQNNHLSIQTRAMNPQVMADMQVHTFYRGGASDKNFKRTLPITRQGDVVKSPIEVGDWSVAMVSAPTDAGVIAPVAGVASEAMPMYVYNPAYNAPFGRSENAAEIFTSFLPLPTVTADQTVIVNDAKIARNVAMVKLVIKKATKNFQPTHGNNVIKLDKVPSTINYAGGLMPNKNNPTTLAAPLTSQLTLKNSEAFPDYLCSDTVTFIIPAHKGVDFLGTPPLTDVTTMKMDITVELERIGGSQFTKTKEIPIVAQCNQILLVHITVDDGMEFEPSVLPWNRVELETEVGDRYRNWLYVKQYSNGTGQSWHDPVGSIREAIERAQRIRDMGLPIHGILVAGGDYNTYNETIDLPEGIRIFGGWEGHPGTELNEHDPQEPYTSPHRDLTNFKAVIDIEGGTVELNQPNSGIDGFIIHGIRHSNRNAVNINNASAWINAVHIERGISNYPDATVLDLQAGTATNILISGNQGGVTIGTAGKLINATVVNNTGEIFSTGTILNSVFWSNGAFNPAGTYQYSAFDFDVTGTGNIRLHSNNTQWFVSGITYPGPHFSMTMNGSKPYYSALNDRAPMLGRGDQASFDSNTPGMPNSYKTDINGKPRHFSDTDMGCYEDQALKGFKLRWASDRVYISSKMGYVTDVPLLLPENEQNNIEVDWKIFVTSSTDYTFLGPDNGSGSGVVVGAFRLETLTNYTANSERKLGSCIIQTQLGGYLPNTTVEIWQTPGMSSVWTDGYVGSFHRNNETSERYVTGPNSGAWTARITSGLDWIKVDTNNKGAFSGVVQETFGGVVSGTGLIKFRVGMKSTLAPGAAPRYGLIVIQRAGGIAMFFVRQGEEADFLYRPTDPRQAGTQTGRAEARMFSPYTMCDPLNRTNNGGNDVGARGSGFASHPSKIGNFFQRNRTTAYLRGAQTTALPTPGESTWSNVREVCPPGWRHGTINEWIHSCYQHVATPTPGTYYVDPTGADVQANFVWGRYADGYYDQMAPDPVTSATDAVGTIPNVAMKGILMVNHYNYGALFFPTAGVMSYPSPGAISNSAYSMVPTSSATNTANTHWTGSGNGHVGISCTTIAATSGAQVRCVRE